MHNSTPVEFNQEHINSALLTLGQSLTLHRKQVLKATQQEFSLLLGISEPTLRKMEKGDDGVSIGIWLKAFQLMQVDQSVVSASRPDSLILMSMFSEAESRSPSLKEKSHG
ncbi:helix-turn-helix transcriptional regulator [Methylotenera sp.]|uniref:helix-turn-helix domain-containing protein n=1 Tax=Methylotenera sp. TaxID=2051956 RepID=UPI0025FDFD6E|nr:helix-turn-helix transcriptional regulator [Methylotenera sp.]